MREPQEFPVSIELSCYDFIGHAKTGHQCDDFFPFQQSKKVAKGMLFVDLPESGMRVEIVGNA